MMSSQGLAAPVPRKGKRAMHYIGDKAGSKENHFNLIRLFAASGVFISHAWLISYGHDAAEPLTGLLKGTSMGRSSVFIFFAISGFFITRSFVGRKSLWNFIRARFLRIFPALAMVLVLTVLALGLFVSDAGAGVYIPAAISYVLHNLSLFSLQFDLPGVFETNPYANRVNGPLWTLSYEVLCYGGVVLCGLLGLLKNRWFFAGGLVLLALAYWADTVVGHDIQRLSSLLKLALPFSAGMAFWVWRDRIPLSVPLALGLLALAFLLRPTPLFTPAYALALAYGVFVLGYLNIPPLLAFNRLGDYSYGVYIYAFPIQQTIAWMGVRDPLLNIALAVPVIFSCAVLSWHYIEAPALRLKNR